MTELEGLVMYEEKKDDFLLEIEGLEEWMEQFIMDPFYDVDGIRFDLFETELTYIVEATLPGYKKEDIGIEVEKNGLHFKFKKQNDIFLTRFVSLPVSLCKKIIHASFNGNILELTIQKTGEVKEHIRDIKIS